jgi:hypothetical protein
MRRVDSAATIERGEMTEREVIAAFAVHLGVCVDRWPEDDNRSSAEIDTIAGPYAIEHTSIDTLPNQRRDDDWFLRVVGGLEREPALPFRLNVTLEYDAVTKGQDWLAVGLALKTWLENEAPPLAAGRSIVENPPGMPFRLDVWKSSDRPPGVFFARYAPEDNTLAARVRAALDRKAAKLSRYHGLGMTAVLLVENDDIALMSTKKMIEAIRAAGLPAGVDQVWYADTCIPRALEFHEVDRLQSGP